MSPQDPGLSNHLARFVLLATGADDPGPLADCSRRTGRSFQSRGRYRHQPLLQCCRSTRRHLLLGGILLLNLAGVLALHWSLFGRRSFWPLASALVAYMPWFLLGFLNWEIGCGLAMLAASHGSLARTHPAAISLRRQRRRSCCSSAICGPGFLPAADGQRGGAACLRGRRDGCAIRHCCW